MTTRHEMMHVKLSHRTTNILQQIFLTALKTPHVIPGLPQIDGKETENRELSGISGLRIHRACSDMETSAPIVQSLEDEVNAMRVGRSIPFSWDTSIYINPLRVFCT